MGWLEQHLEEFVKPTLGFVPALGKDHARTFSAQEMSVIKNMWRSVRTEAKKQNKTILLAGRDVWIFEVLARRDKTETVFRPDISRITAEHVKEDYSKHFLFDTGFMGSIPQALRCEAYTMGSSNAVTTYCKCKFCKNVGAHKPLITDVRQVFPRMKGARSLSLKIERTPKYWRRGFVRNAATELYAPDWLIYQQLSEHTEFEAAAKLTIEIYKDSSPAFHNGPVEVSGHYTANVWGTD
jgi:hypothetical protein